MRTFNVVNRRTGEVEFNGGLTEAIANADKRNRSGFGVVVDVCPAEGFVPHPEKRHRNGRPHAHAIVYKPRDVNGKRFDRLR